MCYCKDTGSSFLSGARQTLPNSILPIHQLLKVPLKLTLNTSRDGTLHFPFLTTSLISSLCPIYIYPISFKKCCSLSSHCRPWYNVSLQLPYPFPLHIEMLQKDLPRACSSPAWKNSNPAAFLHGRGDASVCSVLEPLSGAALTGPWLFGMGTPDWTQHPRWGLKRGD